MRLILSLLFAIPLALAGCVTPAAEEVDAAAVDAPGAPDGSLVVEVAESGETGPGVFAWTPVTGWGFGLPAESYFEVDLPAGTLDAATLTLSWDAVSPATEELLLGIAYRTGDAYDWITVRGASPLVLDESDIGIAAEDVEAVYANAYQCMGAGVAGGCASLVQAFEITGTLAVMAPGEV